MICIQPLSTQHIPRHSSIKTYATLELESSMSIFVKLRNEVGHL